MADNEPFRFNPEDLDRMLRAAGDQLRDVFGSAGPGGGFSGFFGETAARRSEPKTAGETGDGVWAIYSVGADGGAVVEQVFATELDALRANQHSTDGQRRVRFLPYGIAVSVLDLGDEPTTD
jgi:hypothetical protein